MTIEQKLIKNKLGLLELSTYLNNVSEACRVMGYSRDTFYRVTSVPLLTSSTFKTLILLMV